MTFMRPLPVIKQFDTIGFYGLLVTLCLASVTMSNNISW